MRENNKKFKVGDRVKIKEDLRDGDIVTLRNGAKYRKCVRRLQNEFSFIGLNIFTENLKFSASKDRGMDVIKVERPIEYKTVFERVEDGETKILNETEKEYLKAVIKPFKNKVKSICKLEGFRRNTEYLTIYFEDNYNIGFPDFEIGTMYKGMKTGRSYTLEELGL